MSMWTSIRLLLLGGLFLALPYTAQAQQAPVPQPMPVDLEKELALSAIPEHLRAEATVYVFGEKEYQIAQQGSNGFSCLVRRMGVTPRRFTKGIIPICYDAVGSETLLKSDLEQARLFAAGLSLDEVEAKIMGHWETGVFSAPNAVGLAYMLSAANFVPHPTEMGQMVQYIPHLMFYAGNASPQDIGMATPANPRGHLPFMTVVGKPWAMIVVPLGTDERAAILAESAALLEKLKPYL